MAVRCPQFQHSFSLASQAQTLPHGRSSHSRCRCLFGRSDGWSFCWRHVPRHPGSPKLRMEVIFFHPVSSSSENMTGFLGGLIFSGGFAGGLFFVVRKSMIRSIINTDVDSHGCPACIKKHVQNLRLYKCPVERKKPINPRCSTCRHLMKFDSKTIFYWATFHQDWLEAVLPADFIYSVASPQEKNKLKRRYNTYIESWISWIMFASWVTVQAISTLSFNFVLKRIYVDQFQ